MMLDCFTFQVAENTRVLINMEKLFNLLAVSSLSFKALRRQQAIFGLWQGNHTMLASSNKEGCLTIFQADENETQPLDVALYTHLPFWPKEHGAELAVSHG